MKLLTTLSLCLLSSTAFAADGFTDALVHGTPYLDMRYRFEHVDQASVPDQGRASTVRTRAGYRTGQWRDAQATIEIQDISEVGNDLYNNTLNGKTNYPIVADVRSTRLNQAFVHYQGIPDTVLNIGRQAINIDNQRYIGSGEWRQENQTMDAIMATNSSLSDTTLTYGYVAGVNRIFGEHSLNGTWNTHAHVINVNQHSLPFATFTPYAYLLDIDESSALTRMNSNQTYGMSITGKVDVIDAWAATYRAEFATQMDYAANPLSYHANYSHGAIGVAGHGLQGWLGMETLGSDNGNKGFATPLASLHAFNGWADMFVNTPKQGLQDRYLDVLYQVQEGSGLPTWLNGAQLRGQYHSFQADHGNADYGTEWGAYTQIPITSYAYTEVKYADYQADSFASDTQRITWGIGLRL
ncbi:MAG: hypothetical protein EAZ52_07340 [Alphaproteobacteria bacterium]|nr:MAG: hypothetical protein EAZ52_07340 [Alphaproteobacteria bacterium]